MTAFNWFGAKSNNEGNIQPQTPQTQESQPQPQANASELVVSVEKKGMPELANRIDSVMAEINKRIDPELNDLTSMDKQYVLDYAVELLKMIEQKVKDHTMAFSDKELNLYVNDLENLKKSGLLPTYPNTELVVHNPSKVGEDLKYCFKILGFDDSKLNSDELNELMESIKSNQTPEKELVHI